MLASLGVCIIAFATCQPTGSRARQERDEQGEAQGDDMCGYDREPPHPHVQPEVVSRRAVGQQAVLPARRHRFSRLQGATRGQTHVFIHRTKLNETKVIQAYVGQINHNNTTSSRMKSSEPSLQSSSRSAARRPEPLAATRIIKPQGHGCSAIRRTEGWLIRCLVHQMLTRLLTHFLHRSVLESP